MKDPSGDAGTRLGLHGWELHWCLGWQRWVVAVVLELNRHLHKKEEEEEQGWTRDDSSETTHRDREWQSVVDAFDE